MYRAYNNSIDDGNEEIDFNDVIWDRDIEPIINTCRENGIETFTISSTFSSLTETLWIMAQNGCTILGMKEVNASYKDWQTGERAKIPALIIKL